MLINIALMHRSDLAGVLLLEKESKGNWTETMFTGEREHPAVLALVARSKKNPAIIGYICSRLAADEAEIVKLAVTKSARQQGVATSLLHEALNRASQSGATACYLELRASNTPARRLYEKQGFEPTGKRRGYYSDPREDALLMSKLLKPIEKNQHHRRTGEEYKRY